MAGIPTHFDWTSADKVFYYDTLPNCIAALWLPSAWASQGKTSWQAFTHGGGWNSSDKWRAATTSPSTLIFQDDDDYPRLLLAAGFAVLWFEWPMGWQPESSAGNQLRSPPCTRFPDLSRRFARFVQQVKTMAGDQRAAYNITGDPAHTLATADDQCGLVGISSGSLEAGWTGLQPDGAFPYWPRSSPAQRFDRWMSRYSHRVKTLSLTDSMADFRLFQTTGGGVSGNLMPRFGNQERFVASPALSEVSLETLADASILPLIEADHLENRELCIWMYNPGSYGTGDIMADATKTRDQFIALAAPRTPITGLVDVHETGTAILVEEALKVNEARAGRLWEQTKHRIHWGNAVNNPNGLRAIPTPYADQAQAWFDWLTQVVGMVPYR